VKWWSREQPATDGIVRGAVNRCRRAEAGAAPRGVSSSSSGSQLQTREGTRNDNRSSQRRSKLVPKPDAHHRQKTRRCSSTTRSTTRRRKRTCPGSGRTRPGLHAARWKGISKRQGSRPGPRSTIVGRKARVPSRRPPGSTAFSAGVSTLPDQTSSMSIGGKFGLPAGFRGQSGGSLVGDRGPGIGDRAVCRRPESRPPPTNQSRRVSRVSGCSSAAFDRNLAWWSVACYGDKAPGASGRRSLGILAAHHHHAGRAPPSLRRRPDFAGAGVTLRGWRCSPAGSRRAGTIVYLHGIADKPQQFHPGGQQQLLARGDSTSSPTTAAHW